LNDDGSIKKDKDGNEKEVSVRLLKQIGLL
jgi:hypothetical protein